MGHEECLDLLNQAASSTGNHTGKLVRGARNSSPSRHTVWRVKPSMAEDVSRPQGRHPYQCLSLVRSDQLAALALSNGQIPATSHAGRSALQPWPRDRNAQLSTIWATANMLIKTLGGILAYRIR
ncbi:hypothetical protein AnigIFM60653_003605 [Aspergillus niger]|nr:hypothetical protein AnigIFM49718_005229 [Aspergillus niger]GKZ99392.1 hypothetical protein AnigIFM60653_003605 [Aspergillus niger]